MRRGVRSLEARCAALRRAGIPLPRSYRARLSPAGMALVRGTPTALARPSPQVYTVAYAASSRGWRYLGEGWNVQPAHFALRPGSGTVHVWQWDASSPGWAGRRLSF
jgi:hypothetical protein